MLKNILNLEGAQTLSKKAQMEIKGGRPRPPGSGNCYECTNNDRVCPAGTVWVAPVGGAIGMNGSCCPSLIEG